MSIRNIKKLLVVFILLCCLVLFSAFSHRAAEPLLTRLDLALLIERVLEKQNVQVPGEPMASPPDLDNSTRATVARTLALKIMTGYPDGSFRPEEPIPNLETICYLQKLSRFLRKHRPGIYETRQLMRVFAYQSQSEVILSARVPGGSLPAEFAEPGAFVARADFENLLNRLLSENAAQTYILSGHVINSINGEPLPGAYVSSGRLTATTDASGNFSIEFSKAAEPDVELFAVAEGFVPVDMKKDLSLNPTITFRLKPEKPARKSADSSRL